MRRKDKAIIDTTGVEAIVLRSWVCRLAMADNGRPYVIPLCFGYRDNRLYFHCAREGKKLDILRKNNKVCFEVDIGHELMISDDPHRCSMKYQSVVGFGKASFVETYEDKCKALDVITEHYAGRSFPYDEATVKRTIIIRVDIQSMTGRGSGY